MAKVRSAQLERATKQTERAQLKAILASESTVISPVQVQAVLSDLASLLEDGAAGKLGNDVIYRAAEAFRQLVSGRIMVQVQIRPGRKRTTVVGTFVPQLSKVTDMRLESPRPAIATATEEVSVWLRQPPRVDALAPRVHQLIDVENRSFRDAAKVLQVEGHKINSGVVYQIYARYYEMIGKPMPSARTTMAARGNRPS